LAPGGREVKNIWKHDFTATSLHCPIGFITVTSRDIGLRRDAITSVKRFIEYGPIRNSLEERDRWDK
jgi:3-deoxy-D-arabino-heptulosonate 7-phosphate (DAHP) synthase